MWEAFFFLFIARADITDTGNNFCWQLPDPEVTAKVGPVANSCCDGLLTPTFLMVAEVVGSSATQFCSGFWISFLEAQSDSPSSGPFNDFVSPRSSGFHPFLLKICTGVSVICTEP